MTQIWPNSPAEEANKTSDPMPSAPSTKDVIRSYLMKAQVMIGAGVFQLALIIFRSGGNAVEDADYSKFKNAYDLSMIALSASTVITFIIFGLGFWIMTTSKAYGPNAPLKTLTPFSKKYAGSRRAIFLFLTFVGLFIISLLVLGRLRSEKLITNGMSSAGMDVISVGIAILCFVYAVIQIRQAMKLMFHETES